MKRLTDFLFAIAVYSVFVSTPAHAYLDTATISIILQAVAVLLLMVGMWLKRTNAG